MHPGHGGAASDGETAAGEKRGTYVIFSLAEFDPSKGPPSKGPSYLINRVYRQLLFCAPSRKASHAYLPCLLKLWSTRALSYGRFGGSSWSHEVGVSTRSTLLSRYAVH